MNNKKTYPIILEYCGGKKTDILFNTIQSQNSGYTINVLDNSSPYNRCNVTTHQNKQNSFIGGGIKDCIRLAKESGAKYLLFITNDSEINKIDISVLETKMEFDQDIVQLSLSLTFDSDKTTYPWMYQQYGDNYRKVVHSDLVTSMLRLDFLDTQEFPESKSGWGYDWQIGFEARQAGKKVVMCDIYSCRHINIYNESIQREKQEELMNIYTKKYGDWKKISPHLYLK